MMKKILVSVASAALLLQTACAQENVDVADEAVDKIDTTIAQTQQVVEAVPIKKEMVFSAPDTAWRDLDPENTLYIDTSKGRIVLELYPEIAPIHVERIKKLASEKFYDGIIFHRVIEGFMNQTGDPLGDGTGDSPYPDIQAEFAFARNAATMPVQGLGDTKSKLPDGKTVATGFYKALPLATPADTTFLSAKKPNSYGLHCKGVASMARTQIPNSANSQIFLMRAEYRSLDAEYSIWGATVYGHENLTKLNVGVVGEPGFDPDKMVKVRLASDVPASDRMPIQVLKTDIPEFYDFVGGLKKKTGRMPKICDIQVPSRLKP